MNFPVKPGVPDQLFAALQTFSMQTARSRNFGRYQKMICGLLALTWPWAAAYAQSSSPPQSSWSSQPSSSQQSSTQAQTQSQAPAATPEEPPKKEDSLADAARKAKAKKAAAAKGKVYTEEDLSGMKGPGVSVVGDAPKKGARRTGSTDPQGNGGASSEEYWRGRARQILDAIAGTEQQIEQKKEEIKKFGSGGFDVTTGRKDNIAYINDREGQLKDLEKRKADLERQLDELQDEGRKAGASPAWFR
jgi:hypothetical protein